MSPSLYLGRAGLGFLVKNLKARFMKIPSKMDWDSEMKNLVKVWVAAILSLCYCFSLAKRIQPGILRLASILPVIYLFITLPLSLTSLHLGGSTICYLVWLANFKLLLFAFGEGPLMSQSHNKAPLSLLHFVCIGLLPIKTLTETDSSFQSTRDPKNGEKHSRAFRTCMVNAIKAVLMAVIVSIYRFREDLHPGLIMILYCAHLYLILELILAITVVPVRSILGLDMEPQFNEPYLATSLQDFWGRRWNLVVTNILRLTVYIPVRKLFTPILGRSNSLVPAIMATFLVSGIMHEIIYYYITRASPTWEVSWFFILQGVALVCEIGLKKALKLNGGRRWRLQRWVSGPLTVGFVCITGVWLFFPQLIRNEVDLKVINECIIAVSSVKKGLMRMPVIWVHFFT